MDTSRISRLRQPGGLFRDPWLCVATSRWVCRFGSDENKLVQSVTNVSVFAHPTKVRGGSTDSHPGLWVKVTRYAMQSLKYCARANACLYHADTIQLGQTERCRRPPSRGRSYNSHATPAASQPGFPLAMHQHPDQAGHPSKSRRPSISMLQTRLSIPPW